MALPEESGKSGFSAKSAFVAIILTVILIASSSYIAMRMSVLPWPIILSVVLSAGLLKLFSGKLNPHEINVAQAGGSIGGLMASALVFTVPAIWLLQSQNPQLQSPPMWVLVLLALVGGFLGVLLSLPLRRMFIDQENLPYPSGKAGGELIKAAFTRSNLIRLVVIAGLISIAFVALRELFFPGGISSQNCALFAALASVGVIISVYPMPMAVGIGYIIGKKASYSWFFGAVMGWLILVPLAFGAGAELTDAITITKNVGMGIVLGSGIGFLLMFVLPRVKKIFGPIFSRGEKWYFRITPYVSILTIFILAISGVPLLGSVIAVVGVWIMVAVAARTTGETDIDPLEQFGILVGLAAILVYSMLAFELSLLSAVLIIFFVSAATAIAGDIGHDYKSAQIVKTKVSDILRVDLIAVIVAALAGPFVLEIIKKGHADILFEELIPQQAEMVAGAIGGFELPQFFFMGLVFAFAFEIINYFVLKKYKGRMPLQIIPFGIGMFLGLGLALFLFLGGLIRDITQRWVASSEQSGVLVSAGLMGGEGLAGFFGAALFVSGLLSKSGAYRLLLVLAGLSLLMYLAIFSRGRLGSSSK